MKVVLHMFFSYFATPQIDSSVREIPGSAFSFVISVEDVKAQIHLRHPLI